MSVLDRALQKAILAKLAEVYPEDVTEDWTLISEQANRNITYLGEHGLLAVKPLLYRETSDHFRRLAITADGMDFMEGDGGLSAILGVVTIRLHDDTIKALLESKILESDLPPPDKQRYLAQLRSLPAETTKHLVLKLVDKGLENGPAAVSAIGTFLSQVCG